MSMEMTWLDFQIFTDNQNGRQVATNFFFNLNFIFFTIHSSALKLGIHVYRSPESASLLVLSVFMCDQKRYGGHIDFVILFHKSGASNCYQTLSSQYLRKI